MPAKSSIYMSENLSKTRSPKWFFNLPKRKSMPIVSEKNVNTVKFIMNIQSLLSLLQSVPKIDAINTYFFKL